MLNQTKPNHPQIAPQVISYNWWESGDEQKRWPIPRVFMLCAFFMLGFLAPRFGGRIGIAAVFLLTAIYPSKYTSRFLSKGDFISILSVLTPAMIIGNFDAIGDLLGSETIRFSWILLVMAALVFAARAASILKGPLMGCSLVFGLMALMQIVSTFGNTDILIGLEINVSYLLAFLTVMIALARKDTRDAFVWQFCLISVVNSGFSSFEILNPSSTISISSSRSVLELTVRSAGLYANAIASGLMAANCLLLTSMACTKSNASSAEKLALISLAGISGVGILTTFSRTAALSFFLAGVLTAFRLSNNRFGRFVQYIPPVFILILVSFFGAGEYLTTRGDLHSSASSRYTMVKDAMMGDFSAIGNAVHERTLVWQSSRKYWKNPKLLGNGFGFVAQSGLFPPHNMIILQLVEIGWVGVILFLGMVVYLCGFGGWQFRFSNLVLFGSIFLPLALLVLESHSLLTRRYFAIYFVELVFATRILFNAKAIRK